MSMESPPTSHDSSNSVVSGSVGSDAYSDHLMMTMNSAPAQLSEDQMAHISAVQEGLRPGWTVHMTPDGRFYYCK